jgi:hypothetical protein
VAEETSVDPDDLLHPDLAVAAAAAAALLAPPVRALVRRAAVLGIAGLLSTVGAASSSAIRVLQDVREATGPTPDGIEDLPLPPDRRSRAATRQPRRQTRSTKEQ